MASTTHCSHCAASVIWNTPKPRRGIRRPLFSSTCSMGGSRRVSRGRDLAPTKEEWAGHPLSANPESQCRADVIDGGQRKGPAQVVIAAVGLEPTTRGL